MYRLKSFLGGFSYLPFPSLISFLNGLPRKYLFGRGVFFLLLPLPLARPPIDFLRFLAGRLLLSKIYELQIEVLHFLL